MGEWIDKMSRTSVQNVEPYDAGERQESGKEIYLNANENPYPREFTLSGGFNRYPEPQPKELIRRYAKFLGVSEDSVLVTLGGDSSIELLIKAFCEPKKDKLLYCPPTFGMYQITCDLFDVETVQIPLKEDFSLDVEAVKGAIDAVKIIFLCSPNNPTGNLMEHDALVEVLEATKGRAVVVLDEAYIEFSEDESFAPLLDQYPHLALIRTLSKAFGLAGIRCGFTVANPKLIQVLKKVIAPYPVPVPVIEIAKEALSEKGIRYMKETAEKIRASRERLKQALLKLDSVTYIHPSAANWLLVDVKDAKGLFEYLLNEEEIFVRYQSHPRLKNSLRISIGTEEEHEKLLEAIRRYEAKA